MEGLGIFKGAQNEYRGCEHTAGGIPPARRIIDDLAAAEPKKLGAKLHFFGHVSEMAKGDADDALRVVRDVSGNVRAGDETVRAVSVYVAGKNDGGDENLNALWDGTRRTPDLAIAIGAAFRDSGRGPQAREFLKSIIGWVNGNIDENERGDYRRAAFVAAPSMGHPLLLDWYREAIGEPGEEGWLAVKNAEKVAEASKNTDLNNGIRAKLNDHTKRYAEKLLSLVLLGTESISNPSNTSESINLRELIIDMAPDLARNLPSVSFLSKCFKLFRTKS